MRRLIVLLRRAFGARRPRGFWSYAEKRAYVEALRQQKARSQAPVYVPFS